jgi:hypothetical protein
MEEEARVWIGLMLGEPFGEGESFSDGLKNGVRLCRLERAGKLLIPCGATSYSHSRI